jgi:asparagine synthase (glutamine-hydrolysing)
MCGILLKFNANNAQGDTTRFEKALSALKHRGPDDQQMLIDHHFCIGHTRLSIIDAVHSKQPFRSHDGRYTLSFNGEIYNYQALKSALHAQWRFNTQGDTEVLLAGLIVEGSAFISKLRGMWAFALVDHQQQSVLLCRDAVGKKPLYYCIEKSQLNVASELPALRLLLDHQPSECASATDHYFQYGFMPVGKTIYENIFSLLPGEYATWQANSPQLNRTRYWQPQLPASFMGSYAEGQDELQSRLRQAVQKRLLASDVEVGCLLSGGVDSSIIALLAQQQLQTPLKTFCIGFKANSYDESRFAQQVAQRIGSEHHTQMLDQFAPQEFITLLMQHVGQPFYDVSLLPTSMAFALAKNKVKVVLTGDGADELFSGYRRYQARYLFDRLALGHSLPQQALHYLSSLLGDTTEHHSRSFKRKLRLFADYCTRQQQETLQCAPSQFAPALYQRLFPHSQPTPYPPTAHTDSVSHMQLCDMSLYLPQDILIKADIASMANSIEARSPFLDADVIELALSFPIQWKQTLTSGKKILKETYADFFPKKFFNRQKQGFSVPVGEWFKGKLGDDLTQRLKDQPEKKINGVAVIDLLTQHRHGHQDWGLQLWLIYCYFVWKHHA